MTSGRPSWLRRLDAALVPTMGAMIRAVGRTGRRTAAATGAPGRLVGRLARRNPTLTAAIVAVAVASGLIVGTGGDQHHAVAPPPLNPQQVLPGNQLGPTTGDTVAAYEAAAKQRLSELSTTRASGLTAIVDFRSYLTAAAVVSVLAGLHDVTLRQVYAQAPPPADGEVHPIAIETGANLGVVLTNFATQEHRYLRAYRRKAAKAKANINPESIAFLERNRPIAKEAAIASTGIGANLGCVFAVVVAGPPAELTRLAQRSDVRVLDPAPPNVAETDIQIVPLEPLTTDVVPPLRFPPVVAGG